MYEIVLIFPSKNLSKFLLWNFYSSFEYGSIEIESSLKG